MKKINHYWEFCSGLIFITTCLFLNQLFSNPGFLNIRVNDDTTTQIQNEQQIVINPKDTLNFVAVWRDFRFGYRQVAHAASFDGGRTWIAETVFVEPTYIWDSDPGLTVDTAGNFYAVILSFNSTSEPNGLFVLKSTDGGISWGPPVTVINGVPGVFEDKELIACDRSGGPYTNNLYVAWTRFYNTQILISRSTDGGNSFVGPVLVSDAGNVQWPVPAVGPNSEVYVAWCSDFSIRFDRSTNGGVSFGTDRTVQNISYMYRYVKNDILTFSYPAMDVDITGGPYNGYIYIAYMDDGPGGYPDIYFTRSTDRGDTWSPRVRINDDSLTNIDQFHPWLTVDRTGCISVIFYDSRLDPNNVLTDVYLTQSTDGGTTWSPNVRVTTVSFDLHAGSRGKIEPYDHNRPLADQRAGLIGEYNGLAGASKDNVVPIWTDTRLGNQDTYVGVVENPGILKKNTHKLPGKVAIFPTVARSGSAIKCNLNSGDGIELDIFDASGSLIQPIFNKNLHGLVIKGLRSGVYFFRIQTRPGSFYRKITIL
uniref:T9SS type A sorting domain-containing protein n=1 Tax=candidate division WOR-3 bacterium TaxID=2052148 RepID=A0A7C4XEW9_UNCW3